MNSHYIAFRQPLFPFPLLHQNDIANHALILRKTFRDEQY